MSTFGTLFKVTTYGESHGLSVGCTVEGVPPGIPLVEADIQRQLNRRRPGQSAITTPRDEKDAVSIHSGTEFGVTLGTPIGMLVRNQDQRPHDYGGSTTDAFPRPSHADWTYLEKYGIKASSGGGRSSARETIARVCAGAIAEKYLRMAYGVEICAFVSAVGEVELFGSGADGMGNGYPDPADGTTRELLETITQAKVDEFLPVRCPDTEAGARMQKLIEELKEQGDSTGGLVTCVVRGLPSGLGEPCFDKLEAKLAHAMMSIPASTEFAMGSGGARRRRMRGSQHNDAFVVAPESANPTAAAETGNGIARSKLVTRTNYSGGIQGGISNGMPVYFNVSFKPPATISQAQDTASYLGQQGVLEAKGRHDPCVVPRAVPIVEAMAAITVMDALMVQHSREFSKRLVVPPKKES